MLVTASVWQFVKVWLGVIWSYLWRGGYNITCNYFGTLHLGRGEKIFKSLWLYMIFGVKHFCVHFIYCFMLLVKGVRLDWLVFHMISFLLMHILQGCILTFDERQPSMEESFWWKTTFNGRWPLMENNFHGRRPLMDVLWWKTPWKKIFKDFKFFVRNSTRGYVATVMRPESQSIMGLFSTNIF